MNLDSSGASSTRCTNSIMLWMPSWATFATIVCIATGVRPAMVVQPGTPEAPPLPVVVIVALHSTTTTTTRGSQGDLILVTESPNTRTTYSIPLTMVGGYEFLVKEDSVLWRTLLVTTSNSKTMDGPMTTTFTRGTKAPGLLIETSRAKTSLAYSQPLVAVGFDKLTYSSIFAGVPAFLQSFILRIRPMTGTATGFSLGRNIYSSSYPEHLIFNLPVCLFHRIPPLPRPLSQEGPCPSCSDFNTSLAPQHWPFFTESSGNVSLFDFDDTVVLPFKYLARQGQPASAIRIGFSHVSKIWIHPAHHNFHDTARNNFFALKKLRSDRMKDFKQETRALLNFSIHPHKHALRLLAAFRHGKSFYFLFPWANGGSLRSFWRAHPQPAARPEIATWVAEQSLGIVTALHEIHCEGGSDMTLGHNFGQRCATGKVRGYHGDIKAENILLFEGGRYGDHHIWKIGDFGVSKRFLVAPRGGDVPIGFTPTYQSPEHHTEGRIDACADIWSLGCLLLEAVVWLLWGWNGLVRFGLSRQSPSQLTAQNNIRGDAFFEIIHPTTSTMPVPVLKTSVLQCIELLSCDPNASPFLRDLLHLIRHYLLDVNKQSRLASELLVPTLRELHQRCVHVPAYTVALPRPRKPPLLTELSYYKSDKSDIVFLPTYDNPPKIQTKPQIIFACMASSRDTLPQGPSHLDLTMALDSSVSGSSQWLDDFIQYLQDSQSDPSSSTQGHFSDVFQLGTLQETHPLQPNGPSLSRRRGFSSISDPDEQDSQGRTKFRKREKTANPLPINTPISIPSDTINSPHHLTSPTTTPGRKMFACPFSKRTEKKYVSTKDWKCCLGPGPGWTIHRLKGHLYRKHASPNFQCLRCLIEFEDVASLHRHQRLTTPCSVQTNTETGIEKIDAQKISQLKKKSRRCSDEEKWRNIYRIIFPLDAIADIPSPYYEDITPVPNIELSSPYGDDSLSQFQSYLQNRLRDPHRTQQNTSTIQACIDLVQGFRETRGDRSLPVSETPSLVFDNSTFSTMSYEYHPSTSTTLSTAGDYSLKTPHELGDTNIDTFNGLDHWDEAFETRFDKVFGIVMPEAPSKPLLTPTKFQQREGLG
ncbi:kinase-like domain-containing protein [Xylaria digitata]|nr:kinase-like domain-containing protein [Xylaria digitata]